LPSSALHSARPSPHPCWPISSHQSSMVWIDCGRRRLESAQARSYVRARPAHRSGEDFQKKCRPAQPSAIFTHRFLLGTGFARLSLRSAQSHKRDLCDFRKQRDGWCCESTEVSTEMEAQSAMRWRGCAGASVRERLTAAIGARQICVFGETQLSKNRGNGGGPLTALALWSSRLALLASTCRCTRRKHHRQRELQPSNANEPTLPKVSWLGRNRRHPPILIRRGAVLNGP
jgi:hypothetical protein